MNTETKTKHRRYDGKPARQAAQELGINEQNLHKWKLHFQALPASNHLWTLK